MKPTFITQKVSHKTPNDQTIYQLASISKSYTGVLANLMAKDGIFGEAGLDANLVQSFEDCNTEEATNIANILKQKGFENATIAQVLNYTSGIGIINYKSIATSKERSAKIIAGERAMSDVQFLQEELPQRKKGIGKNLLDIQMKGFSYFKNLLTTSCKPKVVILSKRCKTEF